MSSAFDMGTVLLGDHLTNNLLATRVHTKTPYGPSNMQVR